MRLENYSSLSWGVWMEERIARAEQMYTNLNVCKWGREMIRSCGKPIMAGRSDVVEHLELGAGI
jgi:hypothetical protein